MQISNKFTIAIHALAFIHLFQDQQRVTSKVLANSIQANPVIIRSVLSGLKDAGIVDAKQGSGGFRLAKPLDDISLYDIFVTVDNIDKKGLFNFHENPHPDCIVGGNIHAAVDDKLVQVQTAMEKELKTMYMSVVLVDLEKAIEEKVKRT
ncbi:TPA: Rrf2 family transcriptional regulator [Streptococcus suis]|nr:Rrf2 family transcriptional regulator [Streptococcus suis]HEM4275483.1 Rrf2 family transcriptional regulator [Streptococcus suis]HEM5270570.1 Rrf2 family transcriptional regulator [Streptococcus suis]HEM6237482.1 Rrf2 family transcriptional regulator [Streptococcus suis]HEM6261314.1 Rrf2 family transcriptional regulator [Streptococcus suis]